MQCGMHHNSTGDLSGIIDQPLAVSFCFYFFLPCLAEQVLMVSELILVVYGVSQVSVLGLHLFILCTSDLFVLLKNKIFAYTDDTPLLAFLCKPADRHVVVASLNSHLIGICKWCNSWSMLFNPSKTKLLIVRSMT